MVEIWQVLGTALIGALVPIVVVAIFRKPIAARIANSHEFAFEWGSLKMRFRGSEAEEVLQAIFREMRKLIDQVPVKERRNVLTAVEAKGGEITVGDIYPDFEREGVKHSYLRGLRDAQFIRPVCSGPFKKDSKLELKDFGKLMLRYQRGYILTDKAE